MQSGPTRVLKHDPARKTYRDFRSGVSLHSHTMHSKEYLGSLPSYIAKIPVMSFILEREIGRVHLYTGRVFDFNRIYWTPPLSPRESYDLEQRQIEEALGLPALVSLSDHDNIEAGVHLQMLDSSGRIPVSVEWTVPYEGTVFHLGVHNLPVTRAKVWMEEFARYTATPRTEHLRQLLHDLNTEPSVLLVLNHPYWDVESNGPEQHRDILAIFLQKYGHLLHALEVNGFRSRAENLEVLKLTEVADLPVISGGDRHGCEPNVLLNVTSANTFADFVEEIRLERRSQVVLMPQYFEPLRHRMLQGAWDALSDAPSDLSRRNWMTRVFVEQQDGPPRPLAALAGPYFEGLINKLRWVMGLLVNRQIRPAVRFAFIGSQDTGL
jgi:hypothetical protein